MPQDRYQTVQDVAVRLDVAEATVRLPKFNSKSSK